MLKRMKFLISWVTAFVLTLVFPVACFAATTNPFTKMRDKLRFNWKVIDNLDFLFIIFMVFMSLVVIGLFLLVIFSLASHLWKSYRGKAQIGDKGYWIRFSVTLLILFMFFGGALFALLEKVYNWQDNLDIGVDPTPTIQTPQNGNTP